MNLGTYILLFLAGLAAGVINTVGGGGSILTLPALIILAGIPGTAANATNRIGIIVQNIVAVRQFRKGGAFETHLIWRVLPAGLVGGVLGARLASILPDAQFERILGILMLGLLVLVLTKPKPHLLEEGGPVDAWLTLSAEKKWTAVIVFFLLGVYSGFLQAGVGIMILVALGYLVRLDLVRGNYIKLVFTLGLNLIAFGIFVMGGLRIEWLAGIVITAGQSAGALAGSWVAIRKGECWILAILTISILASSAKLLGFFDYLKSLWM